MYIDTFKVFSDLAQTGSFSKAAALNAITQSAVSQQIRALENRFQVTLVERGRRSFALTVEGTAFLEASREILEVYNHLGDRLHALRDVVAGELRIASIYSIGLHELPPRLKAFREKHPEVEVLVQYRRSAQVYAQVLNGEVDLGLVSYPARRPGLVVDVFDEDAMVLICHPHHRLAGHKTVAVQELNQESFIAFEPDLPTRKVIDRYLRDHKVEIVHSMEFDNIETIKRAVEVGFGLAIVPRPSVLDEARSGQLAVVNLRGDEWTRTVG
ncbi:MAG: LysR substrate-binding domain-containing protein, partial [Verrucomicrobiota bacterium]|nr:LysR substrate-binding domain-containing protein [Verrucomicrobiota bacterium]